MKERSIVRLGRQLTPDFAFTGQFLRGRIGQPRGFLSGIRLNVREFRTP